MPSLHPPSTILQSTAVTHVWCPGFYSCHPGNTPRSRGSHSQQSLCSWITQDSMTVIPFLASCHPQGTVRQQTETHPQSSGERLFAWPAERASLWFDTHLAPALREQRPMDATFVLSTSMQATGISWKTVCTIIWFVRLSPGWQF